MGETGSTRRAWPPAAGPRRPPNAFARSACLTNLGLLLAGFAERTGRIDLLDDACATAREALDGAPAGHPLRARAHFALSRALDARYTAVSSMSDQDEAVAHARRGAESGSADDVPRRVLLATHLAGMLGNRAGNAWDPGGLGVLGTPGDPAEIDAPLALLRALAAEVPSRSADRARVLRALGH